MSNILGFNIDNIEDFKFLFLEFSLKVEFKVLEVVFLRRIAYCITIEKKFRKKKFYSRSSLSKEVGLPSRLVALEPRICRLLVRSFLQNLSYLSIRSLFYLALTLFKFLPRLVLQTISLTFLHDISKELIFNNFTNFQIFFKRRAFFEMFWEIYIRIQQISFQLFDNSLDSVNEFASEFSYGYLSVLADKLIILMRNKFFNILKNLSTLSEKGAHLIAFADASSFFEQEIKKIVSKIFFKDFASTKRRGVFFFFRKSIKRDLNMLKKLLNDKANFFSTMDFLYENVNTLNYFRGTVGLVENKISQIFDIFFTPIDDGVVFGIALSTAKYLVIDFLNILLKIFRPDIEELVSSKLTHGFLSFIFRVHGGPFFNVLEMFREKRSEKFFLPLAITCGFLFVLDSLVFFDYFDFYLQGSFFGFFANIKYYLDLAVFFILQLSIILVNFFSKFLVRSFFITFFLIFFFSKFILFFFHFSSILIFLYDVFFYFAFNKLLQIFRLHKLWLLNVNNIFFFFFSFHKNICIFKIINRFLTKFFYDLVYFLNKIFLIYSATFIEKKDIFCLNLDSLPFFHLKKLKKKKKMFLKISNFFLAFKLFSNLFFEKQLKEQLLLAFMELRFFLIFFIDFLHLLLSLFYFVRKGIFFFTDKFFVKNFGSFFHIAMFFILHLTNALNVLEVKFNAAVLHDSKILSLYLRKLLTDDTIEIL